MLAEAGSDSPQAGNEAGMNEIGWHVRLGIGIVLAAMAAFAVRVDILNNWAYGMTITPELASVMVLAAIGVAALPVVASIMGWNPFLRATTLLFVALTIWAAANAYSAKQGANILAAEGAQQRYEDARKDAAAARKEAEDARNEAAVIGEAVSASALSDMVKQAQTKMDELAARAKEIGSVCATNKKCQAAESELAALTSRLGQAKSKEEALARADKADAKVRDAKGEAKSGPAEASMLATVIAKSIGMNAADVARNIAIALTALSIIATQCAALLGGKAASLIASALKILTKESVAARKQKPRPEGRPPKARRKAVPKQRSGSNVIEFDAARHSVERWLESTNGSGEMRGGDALKAYKRSGGNRLSAHDFQDILTDILGAEAIVKRSSGYVIRGRSLRAPANLKLAINNN
jgi:hypothetical protein